MPSADPVAANTARLVASKVIHNGLAHATDVLATAITPTPSPHRRNAARSMALVHDSAAAKVNVAASNSVIENST